MGAGGAALILLPLLISGYLFNLIFYPLRYFSNRADGQRLFFMAAGSGLLLGSAVFLMTGVLKAPASFVGSALHDIAKGIDGSIPVPYACRLLATLFFSVAAAFSLNCVLWLIYGRGKRPTAKRVYNKLTDAFGNPLCQLLRKAADKQKLVMLTLKSRKIYCGRILEVPPNIEREDACVELLPSFSSYRDKDTLRMGKEKTDYPVIALWEAKQYLFSREQMLKAFVLEISRYGYAAPEGLIQREIEKIQTEISDAKAVIAQFGEPAGFSPADWMKVIAIKEIESASFYDADAYHVWFDQDDSVASPPPQDSH